MFTERAGERSSPAEEVFHSNVTHLKPHLKRKNRGTDTVGSREQRREIESNVASSQRNVLRLGGQQRHGWGKTTFWILLTGGESSGSLAAIQRGMGQNDTE